MTSGLSWKSFFRVFLLHLWHRKCPAGIPWTPPLPLNLKHLHQGQNLKWSNVYQNLSRPLELKNGIKFFPVPTVVSSWKFSMFQLVPHLYGSHLFPTKPETRRCTDWFNYLKYFISCAVPHETHGDFISFSTKLNTRRRTFFTCHQGTCDNLNIREANWCLHVRKYVWTLCYRFHTWRVLS